MINSMANVIQRSGTCAMYLRPARIWPGARGVTATRRNSAGRIIDNAISTVT